MIKAYPTRYIHTKSGREEMCQVLTKWDMKAPPYILCWNLEKGYQFIAAQRMGTWMEIDLMEIMSLINDEHEFHVSDN